MNVKEIKIRRGLDIPLKGVASESTPIAYNSKLYAIQPPDFRLLKPRLLIEEGDAVQCGSPLIQNKLDERIVLVSPVSGTVKSIVRGAKRKLLRVEIEADGKDNCIDFGIADPTTLSKEQIFEKLLKSGLWPLVRQRPYAIIATPEDEPRDIFISAFDTSPLAVDANLIIQGREEEFKTGIEALKKLCTGDIHISLHKNKNKDDFYSSLSGVKIHNFSGPHPSGNVGVQIHHIKAINKGEIIWYLRPQDVISLGTLFLKGKVDFTRTVVLAGSELKNPKYIETKAGVCLNGLLEDNLNQENVRVISGDVLTGNNVGKDGYLGFYHNIVSVIPEGDFYEFIGWALPGFKKHSMSKTFFAWLMPRKKYALNTNLHGGHRPFVMTGEYEKVFPFDIYPVQLLKSILVEDIDLMEQLGIYEVVEEDFALCEYVCSSKIDAQNIFEQGIDLMIKELS